MAMTSESDMRAAGTFAAAGLTATGFAADFEVAGLTTFAAEGGNAFFDGFLIDSLIGFFIGKRVSQTRCFGTNPILTQARVK
jgi:hypothetical protein